MHCLKLKDFVVIAGLLVLNSAEAIGQSLPDLSLPWPDPEGITVDGTRVTWPSQSPFTLSDVGDNGFANTDAAGSLFMPPAASAEQPVPAVVLLHGAAGVLSAREITYAKQFAAMGLGALVVDAFGTRRDRATRFVDRLVHITEAMVLADAFAALRYLSDRLDVDGTRVALIGFSYGGMVATFAAYEQVAERYAPDGARFAAHAAFYAPCIARFEDNRATGAPLLMLYGEQDAIVDPQRCAEIAGQLEEGGSKVRTIVYENTYHQWDGHYSGPREIGRNLAPCDIRVASDGTAYDMNWHIPMTGPLSRKLILALCAEEDGHLIGRDDAVRMMSNRDLGRFLESAFRRQEPS
jgi:dienelactone hydrolase